MRRDGVAAISVPELVLDTGDGVWTLPSGPTKTSKALRIPLSPLARSIIVMVLADPERPGSSPYMGFPCAALPWR